jgi:hypothetical protein
MVVQEHEILFLEDGERNLFDIPHNMERIIFSLPSQKYSARGEYPCYSGDFGTVHSSLSRDGLLPPNLAEVASLLSAVNTRSELGISQDILERQLVHGSLWGFNQIDFIPGSGIYVEDRVREEALLKGRSKNSSRLLKKAFFAHAQIVLDAVAGKSGAEKLHALSDRFGGRLYVDAESLSRLRQTTALAPYLTTFGSQSALWLCFENLNQPQTNGGSHPHQGSMYGRYLPTTRRY